MLNTHMMYGTANTHWLNSFFMLIWNHLLGNEPWQLRIHSVLALGVFSFFLLKIFRQFASSWLLLIPVTLLLLNPYLIDYFSLARGYALSIALETVAFYYIIQQKNEDTAKIYFFLSLATLSNYTCIYFLYCYFLLELIDIVKQSDVKQLLTTRFYKQRWSLFLVSLWAIPNILFIKYVTNDLREGEKNGFIEDTLSEFFERSYQVESQQVFLILCTLAFVFMLGFYFLFRSGMHPGFKKLTELLLSSFLLIQCLFLVLNIPYPYGRTALFYIIPFLMVFSYMLNSFLGSMPASIKILFPILIFGANLYVLTMQRNWRVTIEYPRQQELSVCFHDLYLKEGSKIRKIKIGMSIDHYGSFKNYYKYLQPKILPDSCFVYSRDGYDQLTPEEIRQFPEQDYLLMVDGYAPFLDSQIPRENRKLIKHYTDMKSDLIKIR